MALKIIKSNAGNAYRGYRPHWYGVYRAGATVTTFNLGVLIRGEPPASGYIGEKGDDLFEKSREKAEAKFNAIRKEGIERDAAIREKTTVIRMKTGQKFADPRLKDLGDIYLKRIGERSQGHESTIRSGFSQFAAFAAKPPTPTEPGTKRPKKAHTLQEVTRGLAVAFFRHVARDHSFSTVKKYANRLSRIYDQLYPGTDNPFAGARLAAVGGVSYEDEETGEKIERETVVHHKPVTREELRKLYAAAKDDPLLYPLAVTAASTGLRISDCCLLKWDDLDLNPKNPVIFLKTAKTHTLVAVPVFDYDPQSANYDPDLGEFRRVLDTALATTADGEKYVFPEAARLYLTVKKTDADGKPLKRSKWTHPGRNIICQRGKALFARALFADEPTEAEIVADDADGKTSEDILAAIAKTSWPADRKKRIRDIYRRYSSGEGYTRIMKETGHSKSTIAYDLGAVEELVGVKLKKRNAKTGPSLVSLINRTRQDRKEGGIRASVYSWHSLRGTFVIMMKDIGLDLETIRELVGHSTTNMTLQYLAPTQKIAAESARQIILRRNRAQCAVEAPQARRALTATTLPTRTADAPQANLDAIREALAKLAPEERAQLIKSTK